jgi:organic hydroperoxide reductase OsmC/OhrA
MALGGACTLGGNRRRKEGRQAEAAKKSCPVSRALAGPELTLEVVFEPS